MSKRTVLTNINNLEFYNICAIDGQRIWNLRDMTFTTL